MCGFAGVAFLDVARQVDARILTNMRDTLVHRGPDGAGLWISPDARIGLAHRRLAIIDLTENSAQPMANETGSIRVVFNGEIYNHAVLRQQLLAGGHSFRSDHSDTEVLVHGYEQWGMDGLLTRLKGMYAFALWDGHRGQLYLVRDRLGIKPLYWAKSGDATLFASEIKALLAWPALKPEINTQSMYHYLSGMVSPAPLTMFQGVFKLPAAHVLRFEMTGGTNAWCYWDPLPNAAGPYSNRAEYEFALREMLDSSVNEHLVSDVPVGVFLSGGVDSSSILAAMVAAGPRKIDSFSIGFKDVLYLNETNQARDIAEKFGARHHEILINEVDMRDSLQRIFWSQDEPLADWVCVPLFHVAGLASSHVKVAMVGEGADELWAGYDSYRDYREIERGAWSVFRRLPQWLQDFAARSSQRIASVNWDFATAADFAARAASDREVFWSGAMTFWETQKQLILNVTALPAPISKSLPSGLMEPFIGYDTYNVISPLRQHLRANQSKDDLLGRMIYYELKYRLPELLLMRVDKMTMAHSLEARVPFLDHEIVELAMATPSDWKTFDGVPKATLKSAVRGLIPDHVIDGPKVGFGAPMAEWLRGDFGREVESAVVKSELFRSGWFRPSVVRQLFTRHRQGKRNYAHYLWVLYNLTEWHRRWVASSPRSIV